MEQTRTTIENRLKQTVEADSKIDNAYLLVHSDRIPIHWKMAYGNTDEINAHPEQHYHTASIAKTFTAVLTAMLAEQGKLNFQDRITAYLPDEITHNLHVYKGKDYSKDITIEQLLNHTSGLPDFYEDRPKKASSFIELMLSDPTRAWTGEETIEWTKQHLQPVAAPGKKCHYNNTGYNLLGLIIEAVTSKPYYEILHEFIFQPLGMKHTYLSQYSKPLILSEDPVATIHLKGRIVRPEDYRSFSSIFAGGQTVSTSEDLLTFMKALVNHQLVTKETLQLMMSWQKLWIGVGSGYGLMRIQMAPFTEKYNAWGHLGSTGSFMLYNPVMDLYIIGSFNRTDYTTKSIRYVYNTFRTIAKAQTFSS